MQTDIKPIPHNNDGENIKAFSDEDFEIINRIQKHATRKYSSLSELVVYVWEQAKKENVNLNNLLFYFVADSFEKSFELKRLQKLASIFG